MLNLPIQFLRTQAASFHPQSQMAPGFVLVASRDSSGGVRRNPLAKNPLIIALT